MEIKCENCALFNTCSLPKYKVCVEFIFKRTANYKPVEVKTNRIKKG